MVMSKLTLHESQQSNNTGGDGVTVAAYMSCTSSVKTPFVIGEPCGGDNISHSGTHTPRIDVGSWCPASSSTGLSTQPL